MRGVSGISSQLGREAGLLPVNWRDWVANSVPYPHRAGFAGVALPVTPRCPHDYDRHQLANQIHL